MDLHGLRRHIHPDSGSPLIIAEMRHVGGALRRAQPHHGALATFDASFLTLGVGMAFDEGSYRASHERLELLADAFAPFDTGREYLNFTEQPADPERFYTPDAYQRLRAAKAIYDPGELLGLWLGYWLRRPVAACGPARGLRL